MTIFHAEDKAKAFHCPILDKSCMGSECMHWMLRQYEEDGSKRTDPSHGMCGWMYVMAYFRDKNPNKTL